MINVEINGKLVGQCESAGKASSPLFEDVIEPWIEIRGFTASSPSLTDDQQVVLEWWVKKLNEEGEDADPLGVICAMQSYGLRDETIYDAAVNLTPAEQFQVLAAFAEWGLKEDNQ